MKSLAIGVFKLFLIAGLQLALILLFSNIEALSFLVHEKAYEMVAFLAVSMLIIHFINWRAFMGDGYERGKGLLAGITTRLLLSLAFILVMVSSGIENEITFVLNFFILYLSYMLFEIMGIMSNLREISATTDKASKND